MNAPARCPLGNHAEGPPYVTYARMDELHELAAPRTDSPQELTFILISQVKELLFRIVHTELDQARTHLRADRPGDACARLAAAIRSLRVLISAWEVVSGMAPDEFLAFRDVLGEASGTQSFMYRTLEFLLGNKDPVSVAWCADHLDRYPSLRAELSGPSLYDEVLAFLARRGNPLPERLLVGGGQHSHDPAVEEVWSRVYRSPSEHPEEYRLAEALMEVSYQFARWRSTHLLVVERMLGDKPGTGGTTGVSWLRSINGHRFFPELWSVRSHL